jgi:hypothetical protein
MSVTEFRKIEGKGTGVDRAAEICEAIKETCYRLGDGAPVSLIIGALEIAKYDILKDHEE